MSGRLRKKKRSKFHLFFKNFQNFNFRNKYSVFQRRNVFGGEKFQFVALLVRDRVFIIKLFF